MLAVDAFSGDSVPIHLITAEAMDVYLRHMQPAGVIAFHVSNRYLALAPVVEKIALAKGLHAVLVADEAETSTTCDRTDWVLVARDPTRLTREPLGVAPTPIQPIPGSSPGPTTSTTCSAVLK